MSSLMMVEPFSSSSRQLSSLRKGLTTHIRFLLYAPSSSKEILKPHASSVPTVGHHLHYAVSQYLLPLFEVKESEDEGLVSIWPCVAFVACQRRISLMEKGCHRQGQRWGGIVVKNDGVTGE
ncbi:hypothetical protein L2E82_47720 [Cichorium intybus]|uniref:Uncharacterized protein n=1 Tax=Cichorium intybus TaxID=13427 RepID=A0ACB8YWS3_CICIN|nr:hypothetical protein L2E82_47720 [Cichorium intybus]